MKPIFSKTIYGLCIASTMLLSLGLMANEDEKNTKKKKKTGTVVSTRYALNNKSVRIYPDAWAREMHVISKEKTAVQFFVFNTEGELVINRAVKHNEHFKLIGLSRGFYTYHVFDGDNEKATGKFEIR